MYIDIFFSLTTGIGGIIAGFLFRLQLQYGWTGGTDSIHFNFRMSPYPCRAVGHFGLMLAVAGYTVDSMNMLSVGPL